MYKIYLTEAIARQIVQRTMGIIKYSINVMDVNGVIIASGDPSRLYQRHEGAVLALSEKRMIEISAESVHGLLGVKSGINLPLYLHNEIIGVVGISGDPSQVRSYVELVKMAAELILEQVVLTEELQWEQRYRQELVNQLINSQMALSSVEYMAAYLNLSLAVPRVAVILEIAEQEPTVLRHLVECIEKIKRDYLVTITAFNEVVLLKPIRLLADNWNLYQERKVLQHLHSQLGTISITRIIVGGYFPGLNGIRVSYLSARATQKSISKNLVNTDYIFYTENRLPALLNGLSIGWQADELCKSWNELSSADTRGGGVLRKTLSCYFQCNCDMVSTAKQLHIHVNTLRYRLQRIEQISKVNLHELNGLLLLYLGMQLSSP